MLLHTLQLSFRQDLHTYIPSENVLFGHGSQFFFGLLPGGHREQSPVSGVHARHFSWHWEQDVAVLLVLNVF